MPSLSWPAFLSCHQSGESDISEACTDILSRPLEIIPCKKKQGNTEEWLHIWWRIIANLWEGRLVSSAFLHISCLGEKNKPGRKPFSLLAMHMADAKGLFGEHLCCCCAGVSTHLGLLASVGILEAEHFRFVSDFLSSVQPGGEGSCSINHACLAFLGGNCKWM